MKVATSSRVPQKLPDPLPVSELLNAWEALSAEVKDSAEAEVQRRHPNAKAWGEGVLWRALVVAAANPDAECLADPPARREAAH